MDVNELDKLYSPSFWVKRLPRDELISKHIDVITKESEYCVKTIPNELNVSYEQSTSNQKYDIFGTDLPNDAAIFVFIHGGYWQEKSTNRKVSRYIAKQLYKNNHKSIIIGYDLCPNVTLKEVIAEIQEALIKCITYAKIVKSKGVYIAGHSAGAHLISMFLHNTYNKISEEDQDIIKNVFLLAGIYDLTALLRTNYNTALNLNKRTAEDLSPMHLNLHAPKKLKFHVIAAEFDSPAFQEQSKLFYEKLNRCGFDVEFSLTKNVDHFDMVERLIEADYEITKLIVSSMEQNV